MPIPGQFLTAALVHRMAAQGIGTYERESPPYPGGTTGADRYLLVVPEMRVSINGVGHYNPAEVELDLSSASAWDSIATDYRIAANRAGQTFCLYACKPAAGRTPVFLCSANAASPSGYTTSNSRKIGMFHCLCADVGTISGHPLSGYLTGDILPRSIQDIRHRPRGGFIAGMVWAGHTDFDAVNGPNIWVGIYLSSGTGLNTRSIFGGTISDSRTWLYFVDDFAAIGCRMPDDDEFQRIAAGSNEETNIAGSADPGTTGGHSDTAGRRMISNIGCEDCCGVMWQWLRTQSYRFDGAANHTHQVTVSGNPETVTSGKPSGDVAPAWTWYDLPGAKGSINKQGTYGDVKLLGGGHWNSAATAGSRARGADNYRWNTSSSISGRFVAEPV